MDNILKLTFINSYMGLPKLLYKQNPRVMVTILIVNADYAVIQHGDQHHSGVLRCFYINKLINKNDYFSFYKDPGKSTDSNCIPSKLINPFSRYKSSREVFCK